MKSVVKNRFNHSARTYDKSCSLQNTVCDYLIKLLINYASPFSYIADFASGTGESTKRLIKSTDYQHCYAIDFSENLLAVAKKKLNDEKNVHFILADLEAIIPDLPQLDLCLCNMGLQWVNNLLSVIESFHRYLNSDGLLAFSLPVNGNFSEMNPSCRLALPEHQAIIDILTHHNFQLLKQDQMTIPLIFENQTQLLQSLKSVGSNYNKSLTVSRGLARPKIQDIFIDPNNTQLTYKIGFYIAKKR